MLYLQKIPNWVSQNLRQNDSDIWKPLEDLSKDLLAAQTLQEQHLKNFVSLQTWKNKNIIYIVLTESSTYSSNKFICTVCFSSDKPSTIGNE